MNSYYNLLRNRNGNKKNYYGGDIESNGEDIIGTDIYLENKLANKVYNGILYTQNNSLNNNGVVYKQPQQDPVRNVLSVKEEKSTLHKVLIFVVGVILIISIIVSVSHGNKLMGGITFLLFTIFILYTLYTLYNTNN